MVGLCSFKSRPCKLCSCKSRPSRGCQSGCYRLENQVANAYGGRMSGFGLYGLVLAALTLLAVSSSAPAQIRPIAESQRDHSSSLGFSPAPERGETESVVAEVSTPNEIAAQMESAIQLRLEQLANDSERSAQLADGLKKSYQQTLVDLGAVVKFREQTLAWEQRVEVAPQAISDLRSTESTNSLDVQSAADNFRMLRFEQAKARLRDLEAELKEASKVSARLREEVTNREQRRKNLPQLISAAKTEPEPSPINTDESNAEDALIVEAMAWAATASQMKSGAEVKSLETEQRVYEVELELLPLQLERAAVEEKRLQALVHAFSLQISERRRSRIQALAQRFGSLSNVESEPFLSIRNWLSPLDEKDSASDDADVEAESFFSIRNWLLLDEKDSAGDDADQRLTWLDLTDRRIAVSAETEQVGAELARWQELRGKMSARVEAKHNQERVSAFTSWVGQMLRKQRTKLPDPGQQTARLRYFESEMQRADSLLFELDDVLLDIKTLQDAEVLQADAGQSEKLELSVEIVTEMKADVEAYLNDLYEIADVREQTLAFSYDYRQFIDKHVLWIRSSKPLRRSDWEPTREAAQWLLNYRNWAELGALLVRDMFRWPGVHGLAFIGMLVLVLNQSRLRRQLAKRASQAEKGNCVDFSVTTSGLLLTLLISLPIPLVLLFFVWRVNAACRFELLDVAQMEFAKAIAQGCWVATATLFPMELLRQICRPEGLGAKHFGWQDQNVSTLRRNLRWLIDFSVPLLLITGIYDAQSDSRWEASLGRLSFVGLMPLLSIFFARVFSPSRGVFSQAIAERRGGWLDQLKYLWYPAIVGGPIFLAVVSIIGYHYTAQRIALHLDTTLWTVVLLTALYAVLKRWWVVNRRKLMIAKAKLRLEEAAKRDPNSPVQESVVADDDINLVEINEQTRRLVSSLIVATGLLIACWIWSDVLPAISFLDEFRLWTVAGDLPDESVTITLANLVWVVPISILGVIAARNVPGLLEIALLQYLPLTKAARYAITTLARYAIIALAITAAASTIGLRWGSIQWLVAALGVGLGFGLQEIFANFVSGIILLFEQPIRVGDVITLDSVTGTVARIRMRATTIVNWDRQELIIPNKDLITGKLLNWTLTDSTNRIVLNIGVAYGSDTQQACSLIRDVCDQNPDVLKDPAPNITFEGFGDNALNLVLRAFLENLDNRLGTVHRLHEEIYNTLNVAGIELAFPQRDLHLRTIPEPLEAWLERSAAVPAASVVQPKN